MSDKAPNSNETAAPEPSNATASETAETTDSGTSETTDSGTSERTDSETATENTRRVTLPDHIGFEIDRRISETEFDSADEYVTFVLESLFRELDRQDGDIVVDVREDDPDDTDRVQDRLESLGYL